MADKITQVYNAYKADGATRAKSEQQFRNWMYGDNYRRGVWNDLRKQGAQVGTFEHFTEALGYKMNPKVKSKVAKQAIQYGAPKVPDNWGQMDTGRVFANDEMEQQLETQRNKQASSNAKKTGSDEPIAQRVKEKLNRTHLKEASKSGAIMNPLSGDPINNVPTYREKKEGKYWNPITETDMGDAVLDWSTTDANGDKVAQTQAKQNFEADAAAKALVRSYSQSKHDKDFEDFGNRFDEMLSQEKGTNRKDDWGKLFDWEAWHNMPKGGNGEKLRMFDTGDTSFQNVYNKYGPKMATESDFKDFLQGHSAEIAQMASSVNMTPESFVDRYIAPNFNSIDEEEYRNSAKKYFTPKGFKDMLTQGLLTSGEANMLHITPDSYQELRNEAVSDFQKDNSNKLDNKGVLSGEGLSALGKNIVTGGAQIAPSAVGFALAGAEAKGVVKGLEIGWKALRGTGLVTKVLGKAVPKTLTSLTEKYGAQTAGRILNAVNNESIGSFIQANARQFAQGSLTMGVFEANNYLATEGREKIKEGKWGEFAEGLYTSGMSGLGTGMLFSGIGTATGALGRNLGITGRETTRLEKLKHGTEKALFSASALFAEGLGFRAEELYDEAKKGELTFGSVLENGGKGVIDKITMDLGMAAGKGKRPHLKQMIIGAVANTNPHVKFSAVEKNELMKSTGGKSLFEALDGIAEGKKVSPVYRTKMSEFFNDPNISRRTKQKVAYVVGKTIDTNMPRTERVSISQGTSGTQEVRTYSKDGELLTVDVYKNAEAAEVAKQEIYAKRDKNDFVALWVDSLKPTQSENNTALENTAKELGYDDVGIFLADWDEAQKSGDADFLSKVSKTIDENIGKIVADRHKQMLDAKRAINEEYDVDIDKVLDKNPVMWKDKERDAVKELGNRLKKGFSDKNDEAHNNAVARQDGADLSEQTELEDSEKVIESSQAVNERLGSATEVWQKIQDENPDLTEWMKNNPDATVEDIRENFGDYVADAYMELSNAKAMRDGFIQNTGEKIEDAVRNQVEQAKFTGTMQDEEGFKFKTDNLVYVFADKDGNEYTLVGGDVIADSKDFESYSVGKSGLVIFRDKDGNLVQRTNFDGLNEVGTFSLEDYANRVRTTLQEQKTAEIQSTEQQVTEQPKVEGPEQSKGEKPKQNEPSETPKETESLKPDASELYKVADSLQDKMGQSLSKDEAEGLVSEMEKRAEPARELELTPENWTAEFGEDGKVATPLGEVKMGENQLAKLFMKGREADLGMIKPTLTNPDVVIEEKSKAENGNEERPSSYLFVKTFIRDGKKVKFYASVTVKKDGMEVVVSNHFMNKNAVDRKMQEGKMVYIKGVSTSNSSDLHLAEHQNDVPDLLPTQEIDTPSAIKDTNNSSNGNGNNETLTLKNTEEAKEEPNYEKNDIPMDNEGEPVYEQVPKERTAQDLFDKLGDGNVAHDYAQIRIEGAEKELKEAKKKEPKIGTKINEYLKKKQEYEDRVKAAEDKVAYWKSVKDEIEKLTHTTPEELKEAQEELDGTAAREEYKKTFNETQPADGVSLAAMFVVDARITPESFKKETGLGTAEQRSFVGMIANAEKGGKSIERLGEDLVYLDNTEYGGVYFHGDTNDARSAIISALMSAKSRKGLREMAQPDMEREVRERARMRDEAYHERYGMDYEEYLSYSEQEMPHILGKLNNFDEQKYLQDKAEEITNQIEKEHGKADRENDSSREESVHGAGDKVLPEERVDDRGRGESPKEHGGREKDERRGNTENAPLHETPSGGEVKGEDHKEEKPSDPSDAAEGMRGAAEQFHQERVEKARKAYEEAKASGDASETKRTKDEYRKALDDKLKAQGVGLVKRRKTIAKEMGEEPKVEGPKGEEPKSGEKQWEEMTPAERAEKADADPLTEDEIRSDEDNKELAAAAIAYLNGDKSLLNQIAYLKIYGNVRSRHEDVPGNSGTEDTTQLAAADNGGGEGMELESGRGSGGTAEPMDRGAGGETAPGKQESGETGKGNADTPTGEGSHIEGEGGTPGLGGLPAGSGGRTGSGNAGSTGSVGRGRGRGSGSRPSKSNGKRKPAAKQGTTFPNSKGRDVKQETKDAKAAMLAAFAEFKKRGKKGSVSISLVGLNNEQIEYLPEMAKATGRYGIALIGEGIYKAKEWIKNIREAITDQMKDCGFSDTDIDEYIREMWHMPWEMDGETHKIGEWASIKGYAVLRESLKEPLRKKFDKQVLAEPTEVKVGDRKNIEETLPFLLPQQQDDVLKAETQFFDKSHKDKAHANGKGYMFTNGTGTGKTYTGLGIIKRMVKQGKGRILIITPSQQKVKDWINDGKNLCLDIRDLDDWANERGSTATNEKGEGVVITTFANFGTNKKLLEDQFDAIIYDESHRIMENKNATETARSRQHYMLSNRNESYALMRLEEINPDCMKMRGLAEDFEDASNKEIARIKAEYEKNNPSADAAEVRIYVAKNTPRDIHSFSAEDKAKFPELGKIYEDYIKARDHYINNVKPGLEKQAKESVDKTKVVFLSATPFNTRENIEYAEGYLFSYPERNEMGQSGKTQFFLEHFGAGYKYRYHRLESSTSNAEALAKQEIAFSDWLQNDLGTMSGRVIDSPFDYSRDFPTVSVEHADEFNTACEEISRDKIFGDAYGKVLGDYNYGSALFETMKVSALLPRLREHLAAGRKIVIFHRRVTSKEPLKAPFGMILGEQAELTIKALPKEKQPEARTRLNELRDKYSGLLEWEKTLDFSMPREQLAKAFGEDNVLYFSGSENKKVKSEAVKQFNDDNSGKNIIVIQEASGKEGISLHDTTGKHQRVCITLALPQSPITALQIEGRTYRIGNESNAIFEYPVLGLTSEYNLFASKFNRQVSTTENLALGSQARNLRDSFARGIEEHGGVVPIDQQGVGGKEFDKGDANENDPFDNAVLDYYTNQRLNKNNREGVDYFPTPEPLGYKMVEWANIGEGDSVLEPSAGHGAIARYVPQSNELVAIEPSMSLFAKLQMKAGGLGRKFQNETFEAYHISNKHDTIVMNPPFGHAGATAIAHIEKAFGHLEEGGRMVAIIPRGAMDKKFDKWYDNEKTAAMRAEVDLPDIVFQQAGTSVRCRVVVVDKITDSKLREQAHMEKADLSGHYDKIEDFFNDLRNIEVPDRIIDTNFKMQKMSKSAVKSLKEIRDVWSADVDKDGVHVTTSSWMGYDISFTGSEDPKRWKDKMAATYDKYAQMEKSELREGNKAVFGELKELACKLAGMTEDEMRRYLVSKGTGGLRFRMELGKTFSDTKEDFDGVRGRAVKEKGVVMPNLNKESVKVVPVEKHGFGETEKNIVSNAKIWAKENLVTTDKDNLPTMRDGTSYTISKGAIDKYLSESAVKKSGNLYTHISVLPKLKEVIHESLETEIHPDYNKGEDGNRSAENGYGNNVLVHRLYGAVELDGKTYRVKTTMHEFRGGEENKPHSYEVTKIELLDSPGERENPDRPHSDAPNNSISAAKLLKGVEKSYDKGKKLLDESKDLAQGDTRFRNEGEMTPEERRAEKRMEEHHVEVAKAAEKLNTKVNVCVDINDVTNAEARAARERGEKVKAWYDTRTGEVHVYLPNVTDKYDAQMSVAHEVVAHKGMRGLLGEEGYRSMMRRMYTHLSNEEVKEVNERMMKNGWDFYTAMDEWVADKAEESVFTPKYVVMKDGLHRYPLDKVFHIVTEAMHDVGYRINPNVDDVKYWLWASKKGLKNGDAYTAMKRNSFLWRLNHNTSNDGIENGEFVETGGVRFSNGNSKLNGEDSEKLFASLQNKKGKEYYDTVTEIARRVVERRNGKATVLEEPNGKSESDTNEGFYGGFKSVAHCAASIITHDVERSVYADVANRENKDRDPESAGESLYADIDKNVLSQRLGAENKEGLANRVNREIFSRLKDWAEQNHAWLDRRNFGKKYPTSNKIGEGEEAEVYLSKDGKSVLKIIHNDTYLNPVGSKLDELAYENIALGDNERKVIGFMKDPYAFNDNMLILVEQPYVEGKTVDEIYGGDTPEALAFIDKVMKDKGFEVKETPFSEDLDDWLVKTYYNRDFTIRDVNTGNVIVDKDGKPHVIDVYAFINHGEFEKYGDNSIPANTANFEIDFTKPTKKSAERKVNSQAKGSGNIRFRKDDKAKHEATLFRKQSLDRSKNDTPLMSATKDSIDKALNNWNARRIECWTDDKHGLRVFQQKLAEGLTKGMNDSMDSYHGGINQSSIVREKQYQFETRELKTMNDAVKECTRKLGGGMEGYEELNKYAYVKSGLERNRVLFVRDTAEQVDKKIMKLNKEALDKDPQATTLAKMGVEEFRDAFHSEKKFQETLLNSGKISLAEYYKALDDFIKDFSFPYTGNAEKDALIDKLNDWYADKIGSKYDENENDYSGIRKFDDFDSDAERIDYVMNTEVTLGDESRNKLWKGIGGVTRFAIDNDYNYGVISKDVHSRVSSMFSWYIPMRGFKENTMEDMYAYMNNEISDGGMVGSVVKRADGRTTLADSPLGTAAALAERSISNGEDNRNKQRLYRLVNQWLKDHTITNEHGEIELTEEAPAVISEVWYKKVTDHTTGDTYWEAVMPDIDGEKDPKQIRAKVERFEDNMRNAEKNGNATRTLQKGTYAKPFEVAKHKNEHVVFVNVNGKQKMIIMQGNPRPAQAINGDTASEVSQGRLMRGMSAMFTSYNITFSVTNTSRDTFFANNNVAIRENAAYYARFVKNQALMGGSMLQGTVMMNLPKVKGMYYQLWSDYKKGKKLTGKYGKYFEEYMNNGGKTGFVQTKTIEDLEEHIRKEATQKMLSASTLGKVAGKVPEVIEALNERSENMNRFACYVTSREMGRSIMRSVSDAKEVSTNFNRKGSGSKAFKGTNAKAWEKWQGWLYDKAKGNYLFFNAGMQSLSLLGNNWKRHPVKTAAFAVGIPILFASSIIPAINSWIASCFDEDDQYDNLSEWERRNNICIYAGHSNWVKVPLPIELRAFYGLGDVALGWANPAFRSENGLLIDILSQLSQILPLDFMGEGGDVVGAFAPDRLKPLYHVWVNRDWTGKPIYKDYDYLKYEPEYQKVFQGENEWFVSFSKWINEMSGGNEHVKGSLDGKWNNPAIWGEIITGYGGGALSDAIRTGKLATRIATWDWEDFSTREIPMARALYSSATEKTKYYRSLSKYAHYKEDADKYLHDFKANLKSDNPLYVIKAISDMKRESPEFVRMVKIHGFEKSIKDLKKIANNEKVPKKDRDEAKELINQAKVKLVKEFESDE